MGREGRQHRNERASQGEGQGPSALSGTHVARLPPVFKKLVQRIARRLRQPVWRVLERLGRIAHPTNPSGNNQSQR